MFKRETEFIMIDVLVFIHVWLFLGKVHYDVDSWMCTLWLTEATAAVESGMKAVVVERDGNASLSDEDRQRFYTVSSFMELCGLDPQEAKRLDAQDDEDDDDDDDDVVEDIDDGDDDLDDLDGEVDDEDDEVDAAEAEADETAA